MHWILCTGTYCRQDIVQGNVIPKVSYRKHRTRKVVQELLCNNVVQKILYMETMYRNMLYRKYCTEESRIYWICCTSNIVQEYVVHDMLYKELFAQNIVHRRVLYIEKLYYLIVAI